MTRGRNSDTAYVCETNLAHVEPHSGAPTASWRRILGEVLAAEGAERAVNEVQTAEIAKGDILQRLAAEYDYLALLAAAENLITSIAKVMPDVVTHYSNHRPGRWGRRLATHRTT